MKTYQEILNDTIEDYLRNQIPTQTSPEERAAKEYAKQWVEKVVVELSDSPRSNDMMIARLQKRIDAQ